MSDFHLRQVTGDTQVTTSFETLPHGWVGVTRCVRTGSVSHIGETIEHPISVARELWARTVAKGAHRILPCGMPR